jgi:protein required for attachment to host cells
MTTRVVVADEHEARFYDVDGAREPLHLTASLEDGAARLQDRDLESDKPGRGFGVDGARSALDGERSTKKAYVMRFARHVARAIEAGRRHRQFDRLVLIAAPRMLGLIRPHLSQPCRAMIAAEIAKDLSDVDERGLRRYLPRAALARPRPNVSLH